MDLDELSYSYSNLKAMVINSSSNNGTGGYDIHSLKELYRSEINSTRTYSQINDIASLIAILEKRGVLDSENVSSLGYIFTALNLSSQVLKAHKSIIDLRAKNVSRTVIENNCSGQTPCNRELNHSNATSKTQVGNKVKDAQNKLPDEVVSAVACQIGYSWKGLARYLECVTEGTLEKIEEDPNITTNEKRARLVLAEYERKINPSELISRLLKALELLKRKDLHEQVLSIIL